MTESQRGRRTPTGTSPTPICLRRPLSVAAFVTTPRFDHLVSLGDEVAVDLVHVTTEGHLLREAASRRHDIVLFQWDDPADRKSDAHAHALFDKLLQQSRSPIVVYVTLTADAARRLLRMGPADTSGVLFHGIDDASAKALRLRLYEADARRLSRSLARAVAARAGAWPRHLRDALAHAFVSPARYASIESLENASDRTRRTIDRWCSWSGLATISVLLSCAHIAFAYGRLRYGTESWTRLARLSGARSARELTAHLHAICGFSSRIALAEASAETVGTLLERAMFVSNPSARRAPG